MGGPRPTRWEHGWRSGWRTTRKSSCRPSTFKTSQGFLKNHIKPQIGSIPLADLTLWTCSGSTSTCWTVAG
ncbi:MAG: hypothetical protein ACLUEU_01115 [Oscillospiraceae bacterium]